jgi:hypothetical protein
MYRAIIQSDTQVYNKKVFWKMKIPLNRNIFVWYLFRVVILIKDILVNTIGTAIQSVHYVIKTKLLNICF